MSIKKKSEVFYDTYTEKNKRSLKSLTPYINFEGGISYTSKLIKIIVPDYYNIFIHTCASFLNNYPTNDLFYSKDKDAFLLNGFKYPFIPIPKISNRIYNLKDYGKKLQSYSVKECNSLEFLSNYTFGFEFETSSSAIDENFANSLGFAKLYDGSINGDEYVSNPMKYYNFHEVFNFMKILKSLSFHDSNCSLHIHIGNVPKSDEILLSSYSLFQRLQEDLNLIIAPYKKDFVFLAGKGKDHCKNLPLVDNISKEKLLQLFKLDTASRLETYLDSTSKWNQVGRYHTVNFLNYICKTNDSNTIEFRSLQMTLNYDYLLTWLIINTSILHYAVENPKIVLDRKVKIQIEDALEYFIKDSVFLKKVLDNYYFIKNKIYNLKYILENKDTSSMNFDEQFNDLENLTDLKINRILYKNTIDLYELYRDNIVDLLKSFSTDETKLTVKYTYDQSFEQLVKAIFSQVIEKDLVSTNIIFTNINIDESSNKMSLAIYDDTLILINGNSILCEITVNQLLKISLPKKKGLYYDIGSFRNTLTTFETIPTDLQLLFTHTSPHNEEE